jgi:hypothetical protein
MTGPLVVSFSQRASSGPSSFDPKGSIREASDTVSQTIQRSLGAASMFQQLSVKCLLLTISCLSHLRSDDGSSVL